MRLSTCGNVVMFQPLDLPDPDAGRPRMPAACCSGSAVPRFCAKYPASRTDLILAMGPATRPAGAGMQTRRDCQAEVLAFLGDPASHHGSRVRRIDTHASSVPGWRSGAQGQASGALSVSRLFEPG